MWLWRLQKWNQLHLYRKVILHFKFFSQYYYFYYIFWLETTNFRTVMYVHLYDILMYNIRVFPGSKWGGGCIILIMCTQWASFTKRTYERKLGVRSFQAKLGIYQYGRERWLRSNLTSGLSLCTQVFELAWTCVQPRSFYNDRILFI